MEFIKSDHQFVAKTLFGLENVLAQELEELGAQNVQKASRAVNFTGDKTLMYKANLHLRSAIRILAYLGEGKATNEDELYQLAFDYPWETIFSVGSTFAIDGVVSSRNFNHSKYVALKVKDAIADRFRKVAGGRRPNVDFKSPEYHLNVHIRGDKVTFFADSSSAPLFKRGYKIDVNAAPLNEVLAAGMIMLSGWDKKQPFLDPMCGSGTLLAEAGMMAANIAPNIYRKSFGFQNWSNYENSVWRDLIREAKAQVIPIEAELFGADVSRKNMAIAKRNLENIQLIDKIQFQVRAFEKTAKPAEEGVLIMNPPYGERLEKDSIIDLYGQFGDTFKNNYHGWKAWVISSNVEAMEAIGLRTDKRHTLYNGSLECRYNCYTIYEGSKR